ncbi:unnamed protein product [Amoebophrya sp. A120]|nr:unnamed protein product [Amoebophrya sp. A120]|eukprot:GSA120T00017486001.1
MKQLFYCTTRLAFLLPSWWLYCSTLLPVLENVNENTSARTQAFFCNAMQIYPTCSGSAPRPRGTRQLSAPTDEDIAATSGRRQPVKSHQMNTVEPANSHEHVGLQQDTFEVVRDLLLPFLDGKRIPAAAAINWKVDARSGIDIGRLVPPEDPINVVKMMSTFANHYDCGKIRTAPRSRTLLTEGKDYSKNPSRMLLESRALMANVEDRLLRVHSAEDTIAIPVKEIVLVIGSGELLEPPRPSGSEESGAVPQIHAAKRSAHDRGKKIQEREALALSTEEHYTRSGGQEVQVVYRGVDILLQDGSSVHFDVHSALDSPFGWQALRPCPYTPMVFPLAGAEERRCGAQMWVNFS